MVRASGLDVASQTFTAPVVIGGDEPPAVGTEHHREDSRPGARGA